MPLSKKVLRYRRLASYCISKEMQTFAFDANLYEKGIIRSHATERAHTRYVELAEALRYFDGDDTGGLPLFDK